MASDAQRQHRFILDAILLGAIGAFAARTFEWLLHVCTDVFLTGIAAYSPAQTLVGAESVSLFGVPGSWFIPLATTLGGLLSGILVYTLAPEAEGHGTDTAVVAFHRAEGWIRPRVAPIKTLASAITIGSGGAAGREGPAALISASLGSFYATATRRSAEDRRLLLLIGMAAGLSAVFRSPIGTAIFAIEVLYSEMEFETRALLYTMLAAIVAYGLNGIFVGWAPLFHVTVDGVAGGRTYAGYILLGVAAGIVAAIIPVVFYGARDAFRSLQIPDHMKPALGGLVVGLIAVGFPQVLGGGYEWIQASIDGRLSAALLATLVVAKLAAFVMTVGSGGSGGVFAPTLFVGAMLGSVVASLTGQAPSAFAVVGMASVFGAAARVPIATMLMVTEMTAGYALLVPATLAVVISYVTQIYLTRIAGVRYRSLYEGQVASPSDSPAHHADSLRTALRLLDHGNVALDHTVGHLNLFPLLNAGVPVDLPDGNQIALVELSENGPCVGTRVADRCLFAGRGNGRIVALLRASHLLVPDLDTRLRGKDRVIVLGDPETLAAVTARAASG